MRWGANFGLSGETRKREFQPVIRTLLLATLLWFPDRVPAAGPPARAVQSQYSLRWISNRVSGGWTLHVLGTETKSLAELRAASWAPEQWQKLLAVRVESGDALGNVGMPAMLGSYRVHEDAIQFTPQFALAPGLRYVTAFYPSRLTGGTSAWFISTTFELPRRATNETTVVAQIYPSASVLPENLLKFYVHFSAPMRRGHIYDHIHLREASGKDVQLPFLEIDEELWNPELTRLTLFIDPGRIKRGVKPLEDIGPALESGRSYTLVIDRAWRDASGLALKERFEKQFHVGPPDRAEVDVKAWKILAPSSGSRGVLAVAFPKPMDHALAQRMIRVADQTGRTVEGSSTLEDEERRWTFTPALPWRPGAHTLRVEKTIEDLAGNNIGKAFEVDLFERVERQFTNSTVRLPFEVK